MAREGSRHRDLSLMLKGRAGESLIVINIVPPLASDTAAVSRTPLTRA